MAKASLSLSGNPAADRFLSDDPLALLIGMVLDQQVPLERAFSSPLDLKNRLGGRLDAVEIASMDPDKLAAVFATRPALHRFPAANAKRVQELCHIVVDDYHGRAQDIWEQATTGEDLYRRGPGPPGVRRSEGPYLRGLARQATRGSPTGLAGSGGTLRRAGHLFIRGGHRRRRLAVPGPGLQGAAQGGGQKRSLTGPWRSSPTATPSPSTTAPG